jgi:hypothetical protein
MHRFERCFSNSSYANITSLPTDYGFSYGTVRGEWTVAKSDWIGMYPFPVMRFDGWPSFLHHPSVYHISLHPHLPTTSLTCSQLLFFLFIVPGNLSSHFLPLFIYSFFVASFLLMPSPCLPCLSGLSSLWLTLSSLLGHYSTVLTS